MKKHDVTNSRAYLWMNRIQEYLDRYYLDGIVGLIPYGVGDVITALFAIVYVWFAAAKVKSLPLTLAVLNNSLRDILLGLIPFYVGDVIDFFHKSNKQNMTLINGFVNADEGIIKEVNKKAIQSAVFIAVSLVLIALMIWALVAATSWLLSQF